MSNFQDQLRLFEQASDKAESEQAEQEALAARNQAEQISAAHALRATIDSCITEATRAVPSMRTERATVESSTPEWVLHWKDGDRSLKFSYCRIAESSGGHGLATGECHRSPSDPHAMRIEP